MSDTSTQPKTTHPAHKVSTAILALIVLLAGGGYFAWANTEHDGYLTVSIGTNPLLATDTAIPDDLGRPKHVKKASYTYDDLANDMSKVMPVAKQAKDMPPQPQHKPTPPAQVQP